MAVLTIDELKGFLLRAVGEDETIDLSGDILGSPLADLGFDSLAVIATTSALEQHYRIKLGDEDASDIETPQDFLDIFNRRLAQAA